MPTVEYTMGLYLIQAVNNLMMKAIISVPQSIVTSLMISVTIFRINCGDISIFEAFR